MMELVESSYSGSGGGRLESRRAARWMLVVLVLASSTCRHEVLAPLGSPFEIAAGDVVRIDGTELRLHFDHVTADSRCPRDVTCVTAGEAVVAIEAATTGKERETLELHLPGGAAPPTGGGATFGGYQIRIQAL